MIKRQKNNNKTTGEKTLLNTHVLVRENEILRLKTSIYLGILDVGR